MADLATLHDNCITQSIRIASSRSSWETHTIRPRSGMSHRAIMILQRVRRHRASRPLSIANNLKKVVKLSIRTYRIKLRPACIHLYTSSNKARPTITRPPKAPDHHASGLISHARAPSRRVCSWTDRPLGRHRSRRVRGSRRGP